MSSSDVFFECAGSISKATRRILPISNSFAQDYEHLTSWSRHDASQNGNLQRWYPVQVKIKDRYERELQLASNVIETFVHMDQSWHPTTRRRCPASFRVYLVWPMLFRTTTMASTMCRTLSCVSGNLPRFPAHIEQYQTLASKMS